MCRSGLAESLRVLTVSGNGNGVSESGRKLFGYGLWTISVALVCTVGYTYCKDVIVLSLVLVCLAGFPVKMLRFAG